MDNNNTNSTKDISSLALLTREQIAELNLHPAIENAILEIQQEISGEGKLLWRDSWGGGGFSSYSSHSKY